ncbi:RNA polymerase sigma-70 factor, ECF subfamily [Parapedobacter composti]|uniref:RNA polymerase sigma-70 factor, ECF subfamily n=1 Tax=Parapedobacter composti TaxID=623281 RepID=A0A1I1E7T8_9SPHI|nr:RNA polymerase sigma-70 factor [Parapedobacter composti]SFB83134.1 RNA polymerase sigma-70 factor, ECF subfamily [Parapedobacter composti]
MMSPYSELSDHELFASLKEGVAAAYAEIYQRYKGVLYAHAFRMLENREEAKDTVQEVFAALWTKRDKLEVKTSLSAYLYMTIRNKVLDHIARRRIQDRYYDSYQSFADLHENCLTDHALREKELANLIEREINALPVKMKAVFVKSRQEHFSHKEIAEQLNISEKTVKKQINNALRVLRLKLNEFHVLIFF